MSVRHRLRLIVFPMRTNAGLWSVMGPPRFQQRLFLRKMAFDHGGAALSRIAIVFVLPSPSADKLGLHIYNLFRGSIPFSAKSLSTLRLIRYRMRRSSRGVTRAAPPSQIRTCSFPASGSSRDLDVRCRTFALRRL
jgi:hypothetical protein